MSFSVLPAVLVQLIMQQLDLTSLLRLARCNRLGLSAANSDFAFQSAPPLTLCTLQRVHPSLESSPLLRRAPIHLTFVASKPKSRHVDFSAELLRFPRLEGLDTRPLGHLSLWNDMLRQPSLRELRVLRLALYDQVRTLDCAESLPLLMELREVTITCPAHGGIMEAIAGLPQLTCLDWTVWPREHTIEPAAARHLSQCVRLKRLTLREIRTNDLCRFITSDMTALQELTLVSPTGIASVNCLSFAPNLREATFMLCLNSAQQIPLNLRSSASLQLVTFVLAHDPSFSWNLHRDQIDTLLLTFPQLRIRFEMWNDVQVRKEWRIRSRNEDIYSALDPAVLTALRKALMDALQPLCALDPHRVSVTQPSPMQTPEDVVLGLRQRFWPSACIIA